MRASHNRLYSPLYRCKRCFHLMEYHNGEGCRLTACPCIKKNITFKKYIAVFRSFTYNRLKLNN